MFVFRANRLVSPEHVFTHQAFAVPKRFVSYVASNLSTKSIAPESDEHVSNWSGVCSAWNTADQLAEFLAKQIVVTNDHFVVINKPPGLSVWGHSLTKREALCLLEKDMRSTSCLSVRECLPQLAKLLDARWNSSNNICSHTVFRHSKRKDKSKGTNPTSVPSLSIVEPLPASYSGLILLARTTEYARAAEKFYQTAVRDKTPWYLYQRFLAVCMGQPSRSVAQAQQFPIASYALNDHLSCSYKPSPGEISRKSRRRGEILCKHIGHNMLCTNNTDASVISIQTNSSYRGLPELYLLHEGCTVIGELLQSSRLVDTGVGNVILHPSKVALDQTRSPKLASSLRHLNQHSIPVHMHRTNLLIPIPLAGSGRNVADHFRFCVFKPHGTIESSSSNETALHWVTVGNPKEPNTKVVRYALSCCSLSLPSHLRQTMGSLGLTFDYPSWISSPETLQ